ncbi:K(+)-transporting ATPase subunit F [Streptomyces sp. NPDC048637]
MRRHDVGGDVVSAERIVGLLVAASLVGMLVIVVKFPDRF